MARREICTALGLAAALLVLDSEAARASDLLRGQAFLLHRSPGVLDAGDPHWRWAFEGGFSDPEVQPDGRTFRWSDRLGVVAVPLGEPRDRTLRLTTAGGPKGLRLTASWNGRALGTRSLSRRWTELVWEIPEELQRRGVNRLELVGSEAYWPPGSWRRLSFRVDRLELSTSRGPDDSPAPELVSRGPVRLLAGSLLIIPERVPPGGRLRMRLEGGPGAALEVSVGGASGTLRANPGERGEAGVGLGACCLGRGPVAIFLRGSGPAVLHSIELAGETGAVAWRRACGLLPLEGMLLATFTGLLLLAGRARGPHREGSGTEPLLGPSARLDTATVVLIAFALRAAFLLARPPPGDFPFPDSMGYFSDAHRLLEDWSALWTDTGWHRWFSWIRPPGYYLFLALVFGPLGGTLAGAAWIQAGLSAATAGAVSLAARLLFSGPAGGDGPRGRGRGAGLAAGLLFAFDPEAVTSPAWIVSEPLFVFLLTVGLAALAGASVRPSSRWAGAAGAAFGVAALVRSAPLYFVPAAAALLLLVHRRRGVAPAAWLVGAMVLVVLPWSVRNSVLLGHPVGVDDITVQNFLQSHPDPEAVSTEGLDLETAEGRTGYRRRVARSNVDQRLGRRSREILLRGLVRMASRPGETWEHFVRELAVAFGPIPFPAVASLAGRMPSCPTLLLNDLLNGVRWLSWLLGLVGIALAARRPGTWPVLLWLPFTLFAMALFFHVEPRYVFTVRPVAVIFAGAACARLAGRARYAPGPNSEAGSPMPSTPSMPSMLLRLRRRWPLVLGSLWVTTALLWLADATGAGLPDLLNRAVVSVTLAGTGAVLVGAALRLWRGGLGGRILLGLVALSAVAYFTGLAQELTMRYFGDEGIYLAEARRMNAEGGLLRPWFIYPHLLFYLDAFSLWLSSLFEPLSHGLAAALYGVKAPEAVPVLVSRGVTAIMGAALVVPVFFAGRRLAGLVGATLGGALVIASPLLVRVAHLNISDVVGAFFATLCFAQCAYLLESESRRGYLLAGLWAGLAAGGKYPAGVAAVAVAGVWMAHRVRRRNLGAGLLWAALAAILAFLATTPSLVVFYREVFAGDGPDILFGFRQYARSGWSGVVRASNTEYYLTQLYYTLGLPVLVLGLTGILALGRKARRDLLWLTPFPVAYLALILAMRIAVPRNLLPALPALAVLLGAGAAGWPALAARLRPRAVPVVTATVAVVCLALPAWWTTVLTVQFARPTTRELAARWIPENLPPGSFLVQEIYTPHIHPLEVYPATRPRFVSRLAPEQLRHPRNDYVFVASDAYWRFFNTEGQDPDYVESGVERYVEIFETFEPVASWEPGRFRAGPTLRLYEVDPVDPPWTDRAAWSAAELLVPRPEMRREGDGAVVFDSLSQWALAKGYLEPGTYRITLDADVPANAGGVRVLTRDGEEVAVDVFLDEPVARVSLPGRAKYFLYVRLPEGSYLRSVRAERVTPG